MSPPSQTLRVLIVGAGPAGLAAALAARARLRARGDHGRVVVIDKAPAPGAQAVSGCMCEAALVHRLLGAAAPSLLEAAGAVPVPRVDLVGLLPRHAWRLPPLLVPPFLRQGGIWLDLPRFCAALTALAARRGIEVYTGLAAQGLVFERGRAIGVLIGEGNPQARPSKRGTCECIIADSIICADGACGVATASLRRHLAFDRPQAWSLGLRMTLRDPGHHPPAWEHLAGWPLPPGACGGGFCYRPGNGETHLGLILPLESVPPGHDPHSVMNALRTHPYLATRCDDLMQTAGARLLPEGGWAAIGPLSAPGVLVAGDAAGLVDGRRQRGVEWAIASGMAAGAALGSPAPHRHYRALLQHTGVLPALRRGRNFRQVFALPGGPLLAPFQELLPFQLPISRARHRDPKPPGRHPDTDRLAWWARCRYPRHVLPHIGQRHPMLCQDCLRRQRAICLSRCPGGVFRATRDQRIITSHEQCLHCRTCAVICPHDNVLWTAPAEGAGPALPIEPSRQTSSATRGR